MGWKKGLKKFGGKVGSGIGLVATGGAWNPGKGEGWGGEVQKRTIDPLVKGIKDINEAPQKRAEEAAEIAAEAEKEQARIWQEEQQATREFIGERTGEGLSQSQMALNQMITGAGTQLQPYQQTGVKALSQWEKAMGLGEGGFDTDFMQNLPGYQFRLQEGQRALNAAASARGGIGGRALKELTRFGQGLAGEYWTDYMGELNKGITHGYGAATGMADIYRGGGLAHMGNIGNLYGTGLSSGVGYDIAMAQGLTGASRYTAEAQAAAAQTPGLGEQAFGNLRFNVGL